MEKLAIKEQLKKTISDCRAVASSVEANLFFTNLNNKWSIGENLVHLEKSAKSVNKALAMPKEVLSSFGKPMQASSTYQNILDRYHAVLATGVTATGGFVPQVSVPAASEVVAEMQKIFVGFDAQHQTLLNALETFTDEDLDKYQLPHPVLGNLTLREMYYFMDLHIRHHQKAIVRIVMTTV